MAPISPGKMSGPPRHAKKPTATTKAFRFEGFTRRIAKIKIDPVHTVQKNYIEDAKDDLSNSYFRSALDEWSELNLSATFTSFFNKAQPLSESLPQLLHHTDKIFSLLHEHIEKQDVLALEPLLSLVAHLAHDLGSAFEKHFASTVELVARVSAAVDDPESIENCFTCLAWMFKYLSRVLMRDLRPLLEIMIPYFSSKKDYVRRFSAESLAFLLRKAATIYSKKPASLQTAVSYLFHQLDGIDGRELESLETALMTLFSETALGVDAQLHSSAVELFDCVFKCVGNLSSDNQHALVVLDGTIIHLIHQTNAIGFKPLLQAITDTAGLVQSGNTNHNRMCIGLLFDVTTTRKGSRISVWKSVIETLLHHIQSQDGHEVLPKTVVSLKLTIAAVTIQYCPMDQLLPFVKGIVDGVQSIASPAQFFAFCEISAELGRQRFQDLVLPLLQQHIVTQWHSCENELIYLIQRLSTSSIISSKATENGYLTIPTTWECWIEKCMQDVVPTAGLPENYAKYFRLHEAILFPKQEAVRKSIHSQLELCIISVLDQQDTNFEMPLRLAVGWALKFYLFLSTTESHSSWNNLSTKMFTSRPEFYQLVPFLEACLKILNYTNAHLLSQGDYSNMIATLCENQLSESRSLRETSLELLLALGNLQQNNWLTETSALLLETLRVPYSPSNARQIAMLLRRLPKQQELCDHLSASRKLIPLFGLGMLRHYYDQTRKDLCTALGRMASSGNAEDIILDITIQWLQNPHGSDQVEAANRSSPEKPTKLSPFECSNVQAVQKLSHDVIESHSNADNSLKQDFAQSHALYPAIIPMQSRVLALQVFLEVPEIAERRSRALNPVFLSVQHAMGNHHVPQSDESVSSHTVSPDFNDQPWTLQERKLFLELIGKFLNPRVLYRSQELYDHLLELLTNGNPDVRRLSLLAILNWKERSVLQYRDILLRVAEEKNATTELALLVASDEETASIKQQDRDSVLPILLRLVFGQLVGRGSHGSHEAKRKSILRLLFRMRESEVNLFLGIALGRLGEVSFSQSSLSSTILIRDLLPQDQQYGFLRMMLSIQETLQSQYAPYGKKVLDAVLYCTARACHQINAVLVENTALASVSSITRNIRRTGIQCLTTVFEHCDDIAWDQYLPVIFEEIVDPRVPNLAIEFAQGISGILRMFSAWSKSVKLVHLLKRNDALTRNLWQIVNVPSARDDIKVYVLENILMPLFDLAAVPNPQPNPAIEILCSDVEFVLRSFVTLLQKEPPRALLLGVTNAIQSLAPYAVSSGSADDVLNLLISLLCEPAQRVPPHVKGRLLSATESLLRGQRDNLDMATETRLYNVVAGLYSYFKDQPNRLTLGQLLTTLAGNDTALRQAIEICKDLNAVSAKHLDEVDYEKQLNAYNQIKLLPITEASPRQWLPILHNLLYFTRTSDDFAIRSNAVSCLKHYLIDGCRSQNLEHQAIARDVLVPAFKKGIKEDSEIVRADFVAMYGLIIKHLSDAPDLQDLKVLLVGDDEEASFFTNILHIQQHRRLRAIRRLLIEVERGAISPTNIVNFFLPLLEKFMDDPGDDETAQGVKGQAIVATGTLLRWIDWKSFRIAFRRYRSDLDTATRPEKDAIKLLSNAADALIAALAQETPATSDDRSTLYLSTTLPLRETISTELKSNFISKLSKFIHHKDEAEISLRIPAAKVAVKLIQLLPADEIPSLVAPIILDISQILRSRTQESRDIARNTLAEIVLLLGSSSIQFLLKEMRTTLTRGYQLHVLSYTLHTILLQSAEGRKPGDLDYCLEDLVAVIMDDIFGVVGQEKENQDYISSMREVKSSKSQDSMELLAKSASVKHLSKLIQPFQPLLAGNLTTRQVRQVDELFRRIGVGISHNPSASSQDLLVFAYELIQEFYRQKAGKKERILTNDEKNRQRFLIQLKSASETTTSSSSSLQYKIARFALDVVRSTMAKHTSLLTPENVHGFLPIIGDAMVEAQEDVRMSAFRLLSAIVKLPLPQLDENAPLYVMEAVKVVKGSLNTSEEAPQAALKLVAAILRERKHVEVRDSDISYLLHRTMPDIEEPDKQGIIFNFIKAVMTRRYQLPEVYELMDKVGVMMVTNHSRSARDMARGVFVHFLLEYPQSKARWVKQIRFLVKNLDYEFREGRQSVMEAIHVLLQKLGNEELQETVSTFFIPIVLRMANDDDSNCRQMAGALLAQMFSKADQTQLTNLLEPLRQWLEQTDNAALVKVSMQAWAVYFGGVSDAAETEVPSVRKSLARTLQHSETNGTEENEWELQYQALELFSKMCSAFPRLTMTLQQASIWAAVRRLLTSHHAWIQASAAALIHTLLNGCTDSGTVLGIPLTCKHGLTIDEKAVLSLLRDSVKVMKRNEGSLDLAQKTLENLLYLGKLVEATKLSCEVKALTVTADNAETVEDDIDSDEDLEAMSDGKSTATRLIPAIHYLLDQLTHILRREPSKLTTPSFTPRVSALSLLSNLIPQLTSGSLPDSKLIALLIPLTHITDPAMQPPRSADPTFAATYQSYTESAHGLQEAIQRKVGDKVYIRLMTNVSKIVRERRGERRMKRAIDRVAQPERAEREKQRKKDIKLRRKKTIVDIHRKKRRSDLGF